MGNEPEYDIRGAVSLAHYLLRERVKPGDRVLDATCGNGNDTLLLARLVGVDGTVWAFDIQSTALRETARLLEENGMLPRAILLEAGHERIAEFVNERLNAVVFNLGFLPGSDRSCITLPDTTIPALSQALEMLQQGGILLVALYPGHDGGDEEAAMVEEWGMGLNPSDYNVWRHRQLNRSLNAPYLIMVERRRP